MIRIIHYTRMMPIYDDNGNQVGEKKINNLSVTSDNDHDFNEQLETVKSYCDDWTVEEDIAGSLRVAEGELWEQFIKPELINAVVEGAVSPIEKAGGSMAFALDGVDNVSAFGVSGEKDALIARIRELQEKLASKNN